MKVKEYSRVWLFLRGLEYIRLALTPGQAKCERCGKPVFKKDLTHLFLELGDFKDDYYACEHCVSLYRSNGLLDWGKTYPELMKKTLMRNA
jgi:DNA-directed RNA polymerase subunit RPC12/RpoP